MTKENNAELEPISCVNYRYLFAKSVILIPTEHMRAYWKDTLQLAVFL